MSRFPKLGTGLSPDFRDSYNKGIENIDLEIDKALNTASTAVTKATNAEVKSNSIQEQINQLVIEGDSSVESAQARVTADGKVYTTLKERLDSSDQENSENYNKIGNLSELSTTTKGNIVSAINEHTAQLADVAINAKKYGLSETASWETNRDAIQQANDEAASKGGGRVLIPPGTYTVKGVYQDSRVEFFGEGVKLVHPDGNNLDMIRSRTHTADGSITAGSSTLSVSDASKIEEGSIIAIKGAGGISPLQFTTLASAITSTQTTGITLTNATGFASSGFLVVESEIIEYTGLSNGVLSGVTRGRYGTTPAAHASGVNIGIAMRLVAEVISVSGTTITLDRNAITGVSSAPVSIGILYPKITGIKFDGNKIPTGSSTSLNPVRWDLVRFGQFNFSAENAESAIFLAMGTRDCIGTVYGKDCSVPEGVKGAVVWLFQQCHRNHIHANISGDIWAGVYLDNRTSLATEWDGSCDDNTGHITIVADKHTPYITNTGLLIVGSNRNKFNLNATGVRTGLLIGADDQVNTADGSHPTARGNVVDVRMHDGYQPWVVLSTGNTLTGYWETQTNGTVNAGNLKLGVPASAGQDPILGLSPDGTQTKPGMAFESEPNTGFYKIAPGQMQFVSQSQLVARFRYTGLMIQDGKNIEGGTINGVKIGGSPSEKFGFWGQTPIIRPTGTPPAAGDLASTQTLVNFLRQELINMGLIAPN